MRKGTFPAKSPVSGLLAGGESAATVPWVLWQDAVEMFLIAIESRASVQAAGTSAVARQGGR